MLLRRITEHVKAQNWTAVALDFLIVVVGILIAFQITNWSASRGERSREIAFLSALERDINFSITTLKGSISELESQQNAREALYAFHADPDATLEPKEIDKLVAPGVFAIARADVRQVTFETLKSSGQLSLIRSDALIAALEELSAQLTGEQAAKSQELQFTYRFADPVLMNEGDLENILIFDLGTWHEKLPWLKAQAEAGYSDEVTRSRSFKNIVLVRAAFGLIRLEKLNEIQEQHAEIVALIDARQAELGVK